MERKKDLAKAAALTCETLAASSNNTQNEHDAYQYWHGYFDCLARYSHYVSKETIEDQIRAVAKSWPRFGEQYNSSRRVIVGLTGATS